MIVGWETKTLGDVVLPIESIDPTKSPSKSFRYVDVSSVSNETFEIVESSKLMGKDAPSRARRKIKAGDVIFATIRPTLKRIAIVPPELDDEVCSTGYFVFRTKPFLDSRYLFYWLLTEKFFDSMERLQTGASYPAVNDTQVRQQEISYPPLSEQQRIVAILDEAFAGLATATASAEKNLENARELFDSYLNAIFVQRGEGWIERTIEDIAEIKGGKRVPRGYKLLTQPTSHPYLSVTNFNDEGSIDRSDLRYIDDKIFSEISRYTISHRDVYVSIAGTIGKTGIIPDYLEGANLTENACKLVLKPDVSNRFIFYFTRTSSFADQALANTRIAAQPKLALSRLKTVSLGVPALKEQLRLVSMLDEMTTETRRLADTYSKKISELVKLKQSILQKAFAGELASPPTRAVKEAAE